MPSTVAMPDVVFDSLMEIALSLLSTMLVVVGELPRFLFRNVE